MHKTKGTRLREIERTEQLELQSTIDLARKDAAEANRIAEQERLERAKIEERLAPRTLLEPVAMASDLRRFSGQEIDVVFPIDPEPAHLAKELLVVFEAAGWKLRTFIGRDMNRVVRGIRVDVAPGAPEQVWQAAMALFGTLRDAKIAAAAEKLEKMFTLVGQYASSPPGGGPPHSALRITIGDKPPK